MLENGELVRSRKAVQDACPATGGWLMWHGFRDGLLVTKCSCAWHTCREAPSTKKPLTQTFVTRRKTSRQLKTVWSYTICVSCSDKPHRKKLVVSLTMPGVPRA